MPRKKTETRQQGYRKEQLPQKICAHCARPFSWRKKWAQSWNEVRYCSRACREGKHPGAATKH